MKKTAPRKPKFHQRLNVDAERQRLVVRTLRRLSSHVEVAKRDLIRIRDERLLVLKSVNEEFERIEQARQRHAKNYEVLLAEESEFRARKAAEKEDARVLSVDEGFAERKHGILVLEIEAIGVLMRERGIKLDAKMSDLKKLNLGGKKSRPRA